MTEDRSRPNAAAFIDRPASESRGGGNRGMARQRTRGWAFLNFNLMVREQFAAISQLFKFPTRGVIHNVLEA
jgi:hypothetical protein